MKFYFELFNVFGKKALILVGIIVILGIPTSLVSAYYKFYMQPATRLVFDLNNERYHYMEVFKNHNRRYLRDDLKCYFDQNEIITLKTTYENYAVKNKYYIDDKDDRWYFNLGENPYNNFFYSKELNKKINIHCCCTQKEIEENKCPFEDASIDKFSYWDQVGLKVLMYFMTAKPNYYNINENYISNK